MFACVVTVITEHENKLTGGTQTIFIYLSSQTFPSHVNIITNIGQQMHIIYTKSQIINANELSYMSHQFVNRYIQRYINTNIYKISTYNLHKHFFKFKVYVNWIN
jgi:hypothetical protein